MYPVRYRHDHVIVVSRCAHSSHTPLDPYLSARAFDGRRGALSRFSSDGRPRAKGAMRWPRTKNCSAPEHLTPSECRRATGTTLDAEYLSVGLQVRCSVRCSSRCCCCPYFAAHTTHPRATATARAMRPSFTPSACVRRAQISQLWSRLSSIGRRQRGCSWRRSERLQPRVVGSGRRTGANCGFSGRQRAQMCANARVTVQNKQTNAAPASSSGVLS